MGLKNTQVYMNTFGVVGSIKKIIKIMVCWDLLLGEEL